MYSPVKTSTRGRGLVSRYSDHEQASLYRNGNDYIDDEQFDTEQQYNELDYPRQSFRRIEIIPTTRAEYPRPQRPRSFGRIDVLDRDEIDFQRRVRGRAVQRSKSHIFERPEDEREEQINKTMHRSSMENLADVSSSSNVRSFKDQETMIQEIKKENFDLKLRLYMEQKEKERLHEDYQQKVVILETDLTESLDELSDALEREKDYELSLNNARRRERALLTKQRRLEETMREQDEEIKYLAVSRSTMDLSQAVQNDATTQTDRPFFEERGIDVDISRGNEIRVSSRTRNHREDIDGKLVGKQPPEGVDLLNSVSIARKEQILGEARRRRTLKSKKDKQSSRKTLDEMPEVDQTQKVKKKSFFQKLLCCGSSKTKQGEAYERPMRKA